MIRDLESTSGKNFIIKSNIDLQSEALFRELCSQISIRNHSLFDTKKVFQGCQLRMWQCDLMPVPIDEWWTTTFPAHIRIDLVTWSVLRPNDLRPQFATNFLCHDWDQQWDCLMAVTEDLRWWPVTFRGCSITALVIEERGNVPLA